MSYLLIDLLSEKLEKAIKNAFPNLSFEEIKIEVHPSSSEKFGHYQCNNAFSLARILKCSPRDAAQRIVDKLDQEFLEKVEIAGGGYINILFDDVFLGQKAQSALLDSHLGVPVKGKNEKIIVEYSSPNIAKEMHVGHLRSTIIGECLARLFDFLGYDVLRLNHVGDWGTAFGMLIAYMQEEVPEVLKGIQKTDLSHLMDWYRKSKKRFDEDESFKTKSRLAVVALQGGDSNVRHAWEIICEISRKAYEEVYALLDVQLVERGESFYNPMLPEVVLDLQQKGIAIPSEGAICVFIEGYELPLMIQKTDGGYTYDTTDLAGMKHRVEQEKATRIIIVTDSGQSTHFQLIYHAAVKAGYLNPKNVRFDHVPFGVVLGPDGKKFRTRTGETEKLIDLLTVAIEKARAILIEKEHSLSEEEIDSIAKILGIDAVKYADLSSNRISDYVFSYDRMLRFEGNTAAFILYSFVRIHGIKRKAKIDIEELKVNSHIHLTEKSEIQLTLHLLQFGEILKKMASDLYPHYLSDYLYQLAQKFNLFFRDCQVIGSSEQASRLLLCELASKIMEKGLHILGLKTVERM